MAEGDRLHNETSEDVEVRCHARVSAGRVPSERCLHSCTLVSLEAPPPRGTHVFISQ